MKKATSKKAFLWALMGFMATFFQPCFAPSTIADRDASFVWLTLIVELDDVINEQPAPIQRDLDLDADIRSKLSKIFLAIDAGQYATDDLIGYDNDSNAYMGVTRETTSWLRQFDRSRFYRLSMLGHMVEIYRQVDLKNDLLSNVKQAENIGTALWDDIGGVETSHLISIIRFGLGVGDNFNTEGENAIIEAASIASKGLADLALEDSFDQGLTDRLDKLLILSSDLLPFWSTGPGVFLFPERAKLRFVQGLIGLVKVQDPLTQTQQNDLKALLEGSAGQEGVAQRLKGVIDDGEWLGVDRSRFTEKTVLIAQEFRDVMTRPNMVFGDLNIPDSKMKLLGKMQQAVNVFAGVAFFPEGNLSASEVRLSKILESVQRVAAGGVPPTVGSLTIPGTLQNEIIVTDGKVRDELQVIAPHRGPGDILYPSDPSGFTGRPRDAREVLKQIKQDIDKLSYEARGAQIPQDAIAIEQREQMLERIFKQLPSYRGTGQTTDIEVIYTRLDNIRNLVASIVYGQGDSFAVEQKISVILSNLEAVMSAIIAQSDAVTTKYNVAKETLQRVLSNVSTIPGWGSVIQNDIEEVSAVVDNIKRQDQISAEEKIDRITSAIVVQFPPDESRVIEHLKTKILQEIERIAPAVDYTGALSESRSREKDIKDEIVNDVNTKLPPKVEGDVALLIGKIEMASIFDAIQIIAPPAGTITGRALEREVILSIIRKHIRDVLSGEIGRAPRDIRVLIDQEVDKIKNITYLQLTEDDRLTLNKIRGELDRIVREASFTTGGEHAIRRQLELIHEGAKRIVSASIPRDESNKQLARSERFKIVLTLIKQIAPEEVNQRRQMMSAFASVGPSLDVLQGTISSVFGTSAGANIGQMSQKLKERMGKLASAYQGVSKAVQFGEQLSRIFSPSKDADDESESGISEQLKSYGSALEFLR